MKKSRLLRCALLWLLIAFCYFSQAQSFRYKAALDSVRQTGFYAIPLSPLIIAGSKPALEDMRLQEEVTGKEVPYIVKPATPAIAAAEIIDLPLLVADNSNKIIVKNTLQGGISELLLFIKNTEAARFATLSGSDDASHWFVIKENFLLAGNDLANGKESFSQLLSFPYSNYRYFQILLQGKDSLPLNIFKAGIYKKTVAINNHFDLIPQAAITQKDSSDKQSYIWLQWDNFYKTDKLDFSLTGAKFFNRSFILYDNRNGYKAVVASGNAVSGNGITTINYTVKSNRLLLVISNGDDAPLKVDRVVAYGLPVSLIAYLYSGKQYRMLFGDAALPAPAYDLQYFSDSIHNNTGLLNVLNVERTTLPVVKPTVANGRNQWMLWGVIIVVLLLLIYFSYTILKDIKQKANGDVPL